MSNIAPGLYTSRSIRALPTLSTGQCCSLKLDDGHHRVWLCRVAGGVTVERLSNGRWIREDGSCSSRSAEVK